MSMFEKTTENQSRFNEFQNYADNSIELVSKYSECVSVDELKRIMESFVAKINDFYREDRKLNIGVIGQVKAGKSTFLNTLLFDGADVLPSAVTPKTATLTKIEYSETNKIVVEYYSPEEWDSLVELAKDNSESTECVVADEIIKLANKNGINPYEYTQKFSDEITFESADELMIKLNDYVGENGSITPVVKNVTIYIDRPELAEICVVDTPGLNDAIASRTDKTREFIEKCDVVFFLSRASQFLSKQDMELLETQLPQKGVAHMILICSKFDLGVRGELKKEKSLPRTIERVGNQLSERARSQFAEAISHSRGNLAIILKNCENPIFVSSKAYNLSKKDKSEYTASDIEWYEKTNKYGDLTPDVMNKLGNMDVVKREFQNIILEKDNTLAEKSRQFIPNVKSEWNNAVNILMENAAHNKNVLEVGDRESLEKQKKAMLQQINGVKSSLETVFSELIDSLEKSKTENLKKIREECVELSKLKEKTGEEWHTGTHKVGGFSFLCFDHIFGHYESYEYSTSYTYLAASDALESIRTFGYDTCSSIELSFRNAVDISNTKKKLLNSIFDNFDSSDESFDVSHFKHLIELTTQKIEFPVMKIDIAPFLNRISGKFSGEVKNSSDRSSLQMLLSDTLDQMFECIVDKFTASVNDFKGSVIGMQNGFEAELLGKINTEYENLQEQFNDKEAEIKRYNEVIEVLETIKI